MAAENEDPEWLKDALAHRGDPNLVNVGNRFYPGQTPLFDAVNRGRVENMRLLVKAGANVNHQSARGERVLYFAHNQTYEIVLMLLEAGAAYKYPGFDLVEWMNLDIGNDLFRWDDKGKEWFNKTKSFLEKKGERFDEPPTKKAVK
jgi:hypothetical protein